MSSVRFSRHLLKTSRSKGKKVAALLFLALFILGVVLCGYPSFADLPSFEKVLGTWSSSNASESPPVTEYSSFLCPRVNKNYTCPTSRQTLPWKVTVLQPSSIRNCPEYFRWIHEDLRPWKSTGITRAMVERARRTAHFRLLVVKGKLYMESYGIPFQTRDIFTWWGFIQLMRRYPGQIRDLDLMFDCGDGPVVRAADYFPFPNKEDLPPPLFKYCKDDQTLDILFPDWSFWGWTEINIKPWAKLKEEMEEGNKRTQWIDREPYAYWKGNPTVAGIRAELMKCNLSPEHDWNARLYVQDWGVEAAKSFKSSNLADQCINRYTNGSTVQAAFSLRCCSYWSILPVLLAQPLSRCYIIKFTLVIS